MRVQLLELLHLLEPGGPKRVGAGRIGQDVGEFEAADPSAVARPVRL
ncbi:hypothetical protein [Streptomyces sp. NPDC005423]